MPDFEQPQDWTQFPHVVLIIDESGSMSRSRETVISSVNEYIESLRGKLPDTAKITVTKFDSTWGLPNAQAVRISNIYEKIALKDVVALTLDDYAPSGGTPLYDALGITIGVIDAAVKEMPAPVYVAIMTDGQENSSTRFSSPQVKTMIEQREAQGWTFVFMGVEIDAYEAGSSLGFKSGDTVQITRGNIASATMAYSANVMRKFGASEMMFASGATMAEYSDWSAKDDTFSVEDKAAVEDSSKT